MLKKWEERLFMAHGSLSTNSLMLLKIPACLYITPEEMYTVLFLFWVM